MALFALQNDTDAFCLVNNGFQQVGWWESMGTLPLFTERKINDFVPIIIGINNLFFQFGEEFQWGITLKLILFLHSLCFIVPAKYQINI